MVNASDVNAILENIQQQEEKNAQPKLSVDELKEELAIIL